MAKVSELSGALLALWVARAEGICLHTGPVRTSSGNWGTDYYCVACGKETCNGPTVSTWRPNEDWAQAGPLIQKYGISLAPPESAVHVNGGPNSGWREAGDWSATIFRRPRVYQRRVFHHDTEPLTVAMRALVCFVYGDEVPDEVAA